MSDHRAEKIPPQIKRAIETREANRLDHESRSFQELRGAVYGSVRFLGGLAKRFAFENADASCT